MTDATLSTISPDNGVARSRGGQPGNQNRLRHGLRASSLPKRCRFIRHRTDRLRIELEAAIVKLRGTVSLREASLIQSACRWESHSLIASKALRDQFDQMSAVDRVALSREAATATESRDRCISKLRLDEERPFWLSDNSNGGPG